MPTPASPKFHDHEVAPTDWSVNCTVRPLAAYVNAAVGGAAAVHATCTVTEVEPDTETPAAVPLPLTGYVVVATGLNVWATVLQPPGTMPQSGKVTIAGVSPTPKVKVSVSPLTESAGENANSADCPALTPPAGGVILSVPVPVVALWLTVKLLPAMLALPERGEPDVFWLQDTVTVPEPVPLAGDTVIQEPFPDALQLPPWHPNGRAMTLTVCEPAAELALAETGEICHDVHVDEPAVVKEVGVEVLVPPPHWLVAITCQLTGPGGTAAGHDADELDDTTLQNVVPTTLGHGTTS
jgi:hypothetical protein